MVRFSQSLPLFHENERFSQEESTNRGHRGVDFRGIEESIFARGVDEESSGPCTHEEICTHGSLFLSLGAQAFSGVPM